MYYIYGDESRSRGFVVYGAVICPEQSVQILNQTIEDVKTQHGVSVEARFHCRELFSGDARRKSAWKHLNERQAYQFALDLTSSLGGKGLRTTLGIVETTILGNAILPVGDGEPNLLRNEKQLVPFAFQAAVGPLQFDPEYQGRMMLWTDPDNTNIPWFGKNRKVRQTLATGQLDHVHLNWLSQLWPQNLGTEDRPPGLEVADLLAYSGARALASRGQKYDYVFEEILRLITPAKYPMNWADSAFR